MSTKFNVKTFQGMILALQEYWANQGCTAVQPFDMEQGAGTSHPMTAFRALTKGVAEAYYASREALGFPGCKK